MIFFNYAFFHHPQDCAYLHALSYIPSQPRIPTEIIKASCDIMEFNLNLTPTLQAELCLESR